MFLQQLGDLWLRVFRYHGPEARDLAHVARRSGFGQRFVREIDDPIDDAERLVELPLDRLSGESRLRDEPAFDRLDEAGVGHLRLRPARIGPQQRVHVVENDQADDDPQEPEPRTERSPREPPAPVALLFASLACCLVAFVHDPILDEL